MKEANEILKILVTVKPGNNVYSQVRIKKIMLNQMSAGITLKDGNIKVKQIPSEYMLSVNSPVAEEDVRISYQLPADSKVRIDIYDISGRIIKTLVQANQAGGYYETKWTDAHNGMYFCRLSAGDFETVKKVIVMK